MNETAVTQLSPPSSYMLNYPAVLPEQNNGHVFLFDQSFHVTGYRLGAAFTNSAVGPRLAGVQERLPHLRKSRQSRQQGPAASGQNSQSSRNADWPNRNGERNAGGVR